MLQLVDKKFIVSIDEKSGNIKKLYDLVNNNTLIINNYLKINNKLIEQEKTKVEIINFNESSIQLLINYENYQININYRIENHSLVKEIFCEGQIIDIYDYCLENKFKINNQKINEEQVYLTDKIKINNQLSKYEIKLNQCSFQKVNEQFIIINNNELKLNFKIKRKIKVNKLTIILLFLLLINTSLLLPELKYIMYETYIKALYDGEINEKYYEEQKFKGLSNGLNDIYSQYLTQEELDQLNGDNKIVGITFQNYNNNVIVVDVVKNLSAYNNNILPGDYIKTINGEKVTPYNIDILLANDNLQTEVYRPSTNETFNCLLTKQEYNLQTIYNEILDINNQKIGYIKIVEFNEETDEEFIKTLDGMENQIDGLIIDVINNPGGDIETVFNILNRLIGEEQTILEFTNNGEIIDSKKTTNQQNFSKNIYVLQNKNSASSSEILSLVLKEYKNATIIGQTSFGKGVGQTIQPNLFGPGYIKTTTKHWQTGNKTSINKKGIEPDIVIDDSQDFTPILLTEYIGENSQGYNVLKLNNYLKYLGYDVDLTNVFNQKTKKAVISFQQQNQIEQTGILDSKTAYFIYNKCNESNQNLENNPYIKEVFKCLS